MNIYLIGYRGSGKTSVGPPLSRLLGWPFVDMDDEIVREVGLGIKAMVAAHGWGFFRARERALIERLSIRDRLVVATGGGVVLDAQNVAEMKKSGRIVWLAARASTLRNRIREDERSGDFRPALTDRGASNEIEAQLLERAPVYRAAMDLCIPTDRVRPDAVCRQIVTALNL